MTRESAENPREEETLPRSGSAGITSDEINSPPSLSTDRSALEPTSKPIQPDGLTAPSPSRLPSPQSPLTTDRSRSGLFPFLIRFLLVAAALLLIAGFVLASRLEPSARGYGTHQQLGLPPCSIQLLFGIPCPSCGMTTSFAWYVRGQLLPAWQANPAGLFLAMACTLLIPWLIGMAVRPRLLTYRTFERMSLGLFGPFLLLALVQWAGSRLVSTAVIALLLMTVSGCSLAVMAGKMFMGDPKTPSVFRQRTGIDLIEEEETALIVCTTPAFVKAENSALDRDIIEGVYRHFRRQDISCVNPNEVDSWLGRIGGVWDEPSEIAQQFDAKYLIHFDIDSVSYREENSPNFFRGNCHGEVRVYEARGEGDARQAYLIFQHEFKSSYPNHYPISSDNMSERTFAEQYNRRVAEELARLFYDAPAADQMF